MPIADDDARLSFDDARLSLTSPTLCGKKITAAFDGGQISSDGWVRLLARADRRLGLIETLAGLISDARDPVLVTHPMMDLLREPVFAIAFGYADANDLDGLLAPVLQGRTR